jgi:hypothetical protein
MIVWAIFTGLLFSVYLLLADKASTQEIVAGFVSAALAALAIVLGGLAGRVRVSFEPRWLLRSLRAPWWIVRDSVLVALSALRPTAPRGRFRTLRFPLAGGTAPRDVGRRVMVKGPGSAGPNTYVVGDDVDHELLLIHELLPRGDRNPLEIVEP